MCPRERRRERGHREDPGRDRDGHGQHVVGEERRRPDEARQRAEVLARDDVRPAARLVGAHGLHVGDDDDREQRCDRDRDRKTRCAEAADTASSTTSADSVAYATDDSGSEAKIGRASVFGSSVSRAGPTHRATDDEPPETSLGRGTCARPSAPGTRRSARCEQRVRDVRAAGSSASWSRLCARGIRAPPPVARRPGDARASRDPFRARAAGRFKGKADGSRAGSSDRSRRSISRRGARARAGRELRGAAAEEDGASRLAGSWTIRRSAGRRTATRSWCGGARFAPGRRYRRGARRPPPAIHGQPRIDVERRRHDGRAPRKEMWPFPGRGQIRACEGTYFDGRGAYQAVLKVTRRRLRISRGIDEPVADARLSEDVARPRRVGLELAPQLRT